MIKVSAPKLNLPRPNMNMKVPKLSMPKGRAPKPFMPRNRRYNPAPNKSTF